MSCRGRALGLVVVLLISSLFFGPCRAVPQSLDSAPGVAHSNSTTTEPTSGNVVAPNGGPSTGTKTGLAVGIALGVMLMGIQLWLLIQCIPRKQKHRAKGPIELENSQKPIELEGDAPSELLADLCGRHTPVPITFSAGNQDQDYPKDEEKPPTSEPHKSRPLTATSQQASLQATTEPGGLLRESSIRLGESAMTPEASMIQFTIPSPTAPSDIVDPELRYLRREIAFVQEQRTRLERLEQLDALRRREAELQKAIVKIERMSK